MQPGGSETYALTVAEHLARLGHEVMLYARAVGEPISGWAHSRALPITDDESSLPETADAVLAGVNGAMALRMAGRYPDAVRVFICHSDDERYLPPPVPGAVAATVALCERHAQRAAACVGAGEVVRLRQPVDLRVFGPRRPPSEQPTRVLMLGNYHSMPSGRGAVIRRAWADAGLQWLEVGGANQTLAVAEAMADADIVVGYGRAALEGMAGGRAVYVHDHSGTEGWLTADTYAPLEAGGFAFSSRRTGRDFTAVQADLEAYSPELGQIGHELARAHHDARIHAAELVALIERLRGAEAPPQIDRSAMRAVIMLTEAHTRAENAADLSRSEVKYWTAQHRSLWEALERERAGWASERAAWAAEREAARREITTVAGQLAELKATRRYRAMVALTRPLDRLRGR